MWSNFNDSFTAITGHISNLRQSIPAINSSGDSTQLRELSTKIDILKNEVVRHRSIAKVYKEKWLQAQQRTSNIVEMSADNGQSLQDYDDIDLLDDDDDNKDDDILDQIDDNNDSFSENNPLSSTLIKNEELLPTESNESMLSRNEDSSDAFLQSTSNTKSMPKCIKDIHLDSATVTIHKLEDEIKKLQTDGQHWRRLAKEKSAIVESQQTNLDQIHQQLQANQNEIDQYRKRIWDLEQDNEQLQNELQQLDSLHEQEKEKLLTLRNELSNENEELRMKIVDLGKINENKIQNESPEPALKVEHFSTHIDPDHNTSIDDSTQTDYLAMKNASESVENQEIIRLLKHVKKLVNDPDDIFDDISNYSSTEMLIKHLLKDVDNLLLKYEQMSVSLNHHDRCSYSMNELNKIQKEKDELEQKLNELQLRSSMEISTQQHDASTPTTELLSYREEPEGANNETNQYDSTNQQEFENRFENLQRKFSQLTQEHEELLHKYNSSSNENQIFERRYKETEEESIKLSHKIHLLEQERDSLKTQVDNLQMNLELVNGQLKLMEENLTSQKDLSEKISIELNHWRNQCDQLKQEFETLTDDNLRLKSTLADKDEELIALRENMEKLSLADQQNQEVKKLNAEVNRLKEHLVGVEETYLGYLKVAEERYENAQKCIQQYEQMNLEQQKTEHEEVISTLNKKWNEAQEEIQKYEDKTERLSANLVNLQSVIEQLEKEHEMKICSLNEEHSRKLSNAENRVEEWRRRLQTCEEHLRETRQALEAASRLSAKIDEKESIIEQLKQDSRHKDLELSKQLKRIEDLQLSSQGKLDKQIIKNLVLSYLATPQDKRSEGERLLARYLDFNQEEMNRVGILVGRDAQRSNDSFTSKFVQFLEIESQPLGQQQQTGNSGRRTPMLPGANVQQMELARDLNKRLNQTHGVGGMVGMNPFIGQNIIQPTATGIISPIPLSHSRNNSQSSIISSSSTDNQQSQLPPNQLLTNIVDIDPIVVNIPSTTERHKNQ